MIVGSLAVLPALAGCGSEREKPGPTPPSPPARAESADPGADSRPAMVFLGTSLTAGYGLPDASLAYPALIQRRLDSAGLGFRVVNAGISGETSAGAVRRIDWVLSQGPISVLVIETGANDGLRGQDPDSIRANIQTIIDRARALSPPPLVVLAGMEAMPNLGERYAARFRAIYPDLARTNGVPFIPFLLDGVAGVDSLNQADGIHPTARGQELVADNVWRVIRDVLERP